MAAIGNSTVTNDQRKFLASKLLQRSFLKLVCVSICSKVQQEKGTGLTAHFVRYERMNVPLSPLTEGTDPTESSFSLSTINVTLDQWGDLIIFTDIVQLTAAHPVVQEGVKLMADNAARVMDREVQLVWLAGTNVQYGDSTVTTRRTITTSMVIDNTIIHRARITMENNGVPPRDGPEMEDAKAVQAKGSIFGTNSFVAITDPEIYASILTTSASFGTFASVQTYNAATKLYNYEVGTWLNLRWVVTNFIPKFRILGNTTAAVASAAAFGTNTPVVTAVTTGGTLTSATTYFYKVTRKSKLRGFEEDISIAHSTASTATGDNESFTFNFSSLTAGYVYNLYFDSVQAGGTGTDATLFLHTENIEVGTTVTVTAVVTTGDNPPDNVNTTGTPVIHLVYIHGADSCAWVGLQNLEVMMSKDEATTHNPLKLRRTLSYKFMGKSIIKNQERMLRLELATVY
jgi:N4-gp56 family major capsid protein